MKRWWNTSGYPASARITRRRIGRSLMRVVMVGALSLPNARPAINFCPECIPVHPSLPRTGGAVIQAWAWGTLSGAMRPNSQEACDLDHVCALAISAGGGAGTGTGTTIKTSFQSAAQVEPPSNLPFSLMETIDYGHPLTKGVHGEHGAGACYPANGVMAIAVDASSSLVLDIVGMACQVSDSTTRLVFTGTYVTDAASTGTVANADGIGSVSINTPSGLSGMPTPTSTTDTTLLKASLLGQLIYGN